VGAHSIIWYVCLSTYFSSKLQVSFAEYRLFCRALLQKRHIISRSLLVGSLKLQVSFAKGPYKRDDILQKRTVILRSLRMSICLSVCMYFRVYVQPIPLGATFMECCFKVQTSKLERLFCHVSVKRDVRALSSKL